MPAARAVVFVTAVVTVGLSVAAVPVSYLHYRTVCTAGPECRPLLLMLAPQDVLALRELGLSASFYSAYLHTVTLIYLLGFWLVGAAIFWKKRDEWMTLVFSLMMVTFGASNIVGELARIHPILDLLSSSITFLGYVLLFASFFIFPDGRLVPRWGRWAIVVWTMHEAALTFVPDGSIVHPAAWPPLLSFMLVLSLFATMLIAQIYRYRRVSGPVERQQTKVVVFGVVLAITLATAALLPLLTFEELLLQPGVPKVLYALAEETLVNFSLLLIPLSIGIAVLRYRLWDIDLIINRTLVYSALTATVIGLYVLVVGGVGTLLQGLGNFTVSLIAAGIVAILFAPLRDRLQRGVNRLMYGERDDPYRVLSGLGERLEAALAPSAVLPAVTESVAGALKLPYAAITLKHAREGFIKAAEYGHKDAASELFDLPLTHQKETVGELILASRAPGEPFSKQDLRLLGDLSRQIGVAAHSVLLTADLQRSRERLVTAREEERRRLRRDLHDGVGPQLAALMLELETASELVSDDPEASALMAKLSERTRDVVSDVRRSVHALRPPALDELGLVAALREGASQFGRGNLSVSVEAPENLTHLPAATEVACFRIAQEAMTNVVRHAGARNLWVLIDLDEEAGTLCVEVEDDGRGFGENDKVGVGMSSMRERAEELGGRCTVRNSAKGGTLVRATLPYGPDETHPTKE